MDKTQLATDWNKEGEKRPKAWQEHLQVKLSADSNVVLTTNVHTTLRIKEELISFRMAYKKKTNKKTSSDRYP